MSIITRINIPANKEPMLDLIHISMLYLYHGNDGDTILNSLCLRAKCFPGYVVEHVGRYNTNKTAGDGNESSILLKAPPLIKYGVPGIYILNHDYT